jgi:putative two-component system response regulator
MVEQLAERRKKLEEEIETINDFNSDLQEALYVKTRTVVELQTAVLRAMSELVDGRDDITGLHIERTQSYLKVLLNALKAQERGLYKGEISSWNMSLVLLSAQLHDVGKIAIPDSILLKPGKLTDEEFAKIKEHTIIGERVIDKIQKITTEQEFLTYAKIFSGTHHEKWNGTGYPRGLKGEEIPLLGRIMAIADVYDALVFERPYKKAFPHEEAVDIIVSEKGRHFDPVLVDLFLSVSDQFEEIDKRYKSSPRDAVQSQSH